MGLERRPDRLDQLVVGQDAQVAVRTGGHLKNHMNWSRYMVYLIVVINNWARRMNGHALKIFYNFFRTLPDTVEHG